MMLGPWNCISVLLKGRSSHSNTIKTIIISSSTWTTLCDFPDFIFSISPSLSWLVLLYLSVITLHNYYTINNDATTKIWESFHHLFNPPAVASSRCSLPFRCLPTYSIPPWEHHSNRKWRPSMPLRYSSSSSSVAVAWSLLHHQQFRDLWKIITTRLHFTLALSLRIPTSPPPSPLLHYYYLPLSLFALLRCIYNWRDAPLFLCSNKLLLRLLLLLCFSHTRHNSTSTGRIKSRCLIKQQRICHNKVGADDAFLGKSKRVSLLFSFKLQFHESHTNHQYTRAHREIELRDSH